MTLLPTPLCHTVWNEMAAFQGFLRFVAVRQQQGVVNAFESQLTQGEAVQGGYAPQGYHHNY